MKIVQMESDVSVTAPVQCPAEAIAREYEKCRRVGDGCGEGGMSFEEIVACTDYADHLLDRLSWTQTQSFNGAVLPMQRALELLNKKQDESFDRQGFPDGELAEALRHIHSVLVVVKREVTADQSELGTDWHGGRDSRPNMQKVAAAYAALEA